MTTHCPELLKTILGIIPHPDSREADESELMPSQTFRKALRIVLTIAHYQMQSRTTPRRKIRRIGGMPAHEADAILDLLRFADIVTGDDNGYRVSRSMRMVSLAEIYAAITPARKLPKTSFDHFYDALIDKARKAAISDLDGIDLSSTLAEALGAEQGLTLEMAERGH
jgi:DNA-binding IscR family transcriptional regulator